MKRKYGNPKVKVGDWVYFLEDEKYETRFKYKVVLVKSVGMITVEVNHNKKDSFVGGWQCIDIGEGIYWNVISWCKEKSKELNIE